MMRKLVILSLELSLIVLLCAPSAYAVTVFVGDFDGFGIPPNLVPTLDGNSWPNGTTFRADRNNDGILSDGDVLPDIYGPFDVVNNNHPKLDDPTLLDPDGTTNGWDFFDNRGSYELNSANGAIFTDIGLATSTHLQVFPIPGAAKNAVFTFKFLVPPSGTPGYGLDHYFSLIYGDYDVGYMEVIIDGQTVGLTGNRNTGLDGYVGMAYAVVPWSQMLDGVVVVQVVAPQEPFVVFDVLKLDTTPFFPPVPNLPTAPPVIGVAKKVVSVINKGAGTYTVEYEILVENLGTVPLSNVQVEEDLDSTFAGANGFVVIHTPSNPFSTVFTVNPSFDGSTDKVLVGNGSLLPGDSGVIQLAVDVTPGNNWGPYDNTAVGHAQGPYGTPTSDKSDDDTSLNPDPNGNGNPNEPGENDPTPVTFTENPVIGVAKRVVPPVVNNNGIYTVTYEIVVENLGDVDLLNVQVDEDLSTTFPLPITVNVSSATFSVNTGFDGVTDIQLLTPGANTLPVGGTGIIQMIVTVTPAQFATPYTNTVQATAVGPGGTPTNDVSDNGIDPDPNGNGNPNEPGENDPTPVTFLSTGLDSDNDGLSDNDELTIYGTDPLNPDTDNDGLNDGDEITIYGTDPLNPDTDNDGVNDGDEITIYGTDPLNPDTDNDGLNDGNELAIGTDPLNPDTDNDGLNDGVDPFPLVPYNSGGGGGGRTPSPTPIPEPGTFLLLGAGLIGILALRRRRRK